jgi:hypothetical protein
MSELFPLFGGLFAGVAIRWLARPENRLQWLIVQGTVVGGVATLASGEYRFGWHFLLIDAALAIGAALGASVCAAIWDVFLRFSHARNCSRKILSPLDSAN